MLRQLLREWPPGTSTHHWEVAAIMRHPRPHRG